MALWKKVLAGWVIVMGVWMYGTNFYEGQSGTAGACSVGYVYDGDTVALNCAGAEHTARLQGFDTPETRNSGCPEEATLGRAATLRLRALIASGQVSYRASGHDKYGRQLIRLRVDGVDVGDTLIQEGLALHYTGGKRVNWCRRLGAG